MNTFARILNTPAETRPSYTPEELEAQRKEQNSKMMERALRVQIAQMQKGRSLTEEELESALAHTPTEEEIAAHLALTGLIY
jgi:hypothetical protein